MVLLLRFAADDDAISRFSERRGDHLRPRKFDTPNTNALAFYAGSAPHRASVHQPELATGAQTSV